MTGGNALAPGIDGLIDMADPGASAAAGRFRLIGARTGSWSVKAGAASRLVPNVAARSPTDWST